MSFSDYIDLFLNFGRSDGFELINMLVVLGSALGGIIALINFLKKALYLGGQPSGKAKVQSLFIGFLIVILFGVSIIVLLKGLLRNDDALLFTAVTLSACYTMILSGFIFFASLKIWSSNADILDFALMCLVTFLTTLYSLLLLNMANISFPIGTTAIAASTMSILFLAMEKILFPKNNLLARPFSKIASWAFDNEKPKYSDFEEENAGKQINQGDEDVVFTTWRQFKTVGEVVTLLLVYFLLCGGFAYMFMATSAA